MATRKTKDKDDYGEGSIRVLKGLEPVKQRPGMYTLTENPLHIIQEVIDNASDEVLAGYGSRISVSVAEDGSVTVEDDGRGIPIGMHPEEKAPVVELVFTRLHAGGKFAKADGTGPYSFAGGLHGVGVSVTNALSKRLVVTVWRDGEEARLGFADGFVAEPLEVRRSPRPKSRTGTRVTVWPDPKYFDSPDIPEAALVRLLRSKAVLLPGVRGRLRQRPHEDGVALALRGGPQGVPALRDSRRDPDRALRGVGLRRRVDRGVRAGRGRLLGRRVDGRGAAHARELRQSHPHAAGRHA